MTIFERALKKAQLAEGRPPAHSQARTQNVPENGHHGDVPTDNVSPVRSLQSADSVLLDLPALRRAGLLSPEENERITMRQYRRIRRPILSNAFGRDGPAVPGGRLVAVSSALPGEGKTFTSFNLALNLALERNAQVLLVDADVAKRSLSVSLNLGDRPGLLDVISSQGAGIESVVLATNLPGLFVVPSGAFREDASELIESVHLKNLFEVFLLHYPDFIVVFDTAPLLLTSESRAIAQLAGQIILVVKAETTLRECVVDAIALIPSTENKFVAAILNQCPPRRDAENTYGDYY